MDTKTKLKLRKFIRELEQIRGRHTELVSVYVPSGYDLIKIIQHLQEEQGTASNIKDKTTRTHVIDSLERMIRHLRLFKATPQNGLAVFAGNASERDNIVDIKVWSVEPPEPVTARMYRCDQNFVLDPLRAMIEHKETYGLIVMDRREATIGFLRGTSIVVAEHMTSGVPGKVKAGGQSAHRFERLRENAAVEFYKRISEICNKEFLNMKELKGILVGGPGPTKDEFIEYLNNEVKKKILAVQDLTYTDESGLHDLVDRSRDTLAKEAVAEEKAIMEKFLTMLAKELGKVTYGYNDVKKALDIGAVDTLLLSEELSDDKLEELEKLASDTGTTVKIISVETREGKQLRDLGGVAAILRYSLS